MLRLLAYSKEHIVYHRYLSSLMLSFFIYSTMAWSLFYFYICDTSKIETQTKEPSKLQISLVSLSTPKPHAQPKSIIEKEFVTKEVVRQEPKITQEIMTKKPLKTASFEEEAAQKEMVQDREEIKIVQEIFTPQSTAKDTNPDERILSQEELKVKQNLFLEQMRHTIDKNKVYPNSARRRAIEGEVQISFFLQEDGNVKNIELVLGKSIFKDSAIEAIAKSFPLKVEKELFDFPKKFYITLAYSLTSS